MSMRKRELGLLALLCLLSYSFCRDIKDLVDDISEESSSSDLLVNVTEMNVLKEALLQDILYTRRKDRIQDHEYEKYHNPHDSWSNCGEPGDLLTLKDLKITPDPPVRGEPLTIAFEGDLREPIEGSESVNIQVKYGVIKIVDMTTNLCEQLSKVEDVPQCPFSPGLWRFNHTEVLPSDIPAGRYTLTIEAYSKKFKKGIFCISGTFRFDPTIFNWW